MNEQDLFEIMDGLPARQIAEAAEWKYRRGSGSDNEIDTILTGSTMPEKITYRDTKPETIDIADEPVNLHRQPGTEKQPRVIRSATAGLAAVAAIFALIFGGIALKLHRDNTGIEASLPGTVITDISVTEVTGTDLAALTVAPTGEFTTIVTTTEMLSFTPIENPIPQQPDESVSAGETNFLGGKGLLRPVTAEGDPCILQDDEYIYLYGSEKVRKTGLDALREPNPELICQTAGCAHMSDDCLLYKYGNGHLMCSGQDIFYADWTTESVQAGYAGGLHRIYSDGTTEEIHPQRKISAADETNGTIIGRIHYTHILRLGDTGIYYLKGYGMRYSAGESGLDRVFQPMLLNSRTGETITLNISEISRNAYIEDYAVMFDAASGHMFLSITNGFTDTCTEIAEIDIYTGEILQNYNSWDESAEIQSWFVKDHQLHYLGEMPEDRYKVNWYVHDMDTQETKVIMKDCGLSSFAYCDGKVYATHHASVGNDAIYSYAPDGSDQTALAEYNTVFRSLAPVSDPDCIVLESSIGSQYILMNGRTYRLQ